MADFGQSAGGDYGFVGLVVSAAGDAVSAYVTDSDLLAPPTGSVSARNLAYQRAALPPQPPPPATREVDDDFPHTGGFWARGTGYDGRSAALHFSAPVVDIFLVVDLEAELPFGVYSDTQGYWLNFAATPTAQAGGYVYQVAAPDSQHYSGGWVFHPDGRVRGGLTRVADSARTTAPSFTPGPATLAVVVPEWNVTLAVELATALAPGR